METPHFHRKLSSQNPVLRQIELRVQNGPVTKNGILPLTTLFFFENLISVLEPLINN